MAVLSVSASLIHHTPYPLLHSISAQDSPSCLKFQSLSLKSQSNSISNGKRFLLSVSPAVKNQRFETVDEDIDEGEELESNETLLYSISPLPLLFVAALPGASTLRSLFEPFVELIKTWNLPGWLVHWGHPGNMVRRARAKHGLAVKQPSRPKNYVDRK